MNTINRYKNSSRKTKAHSRKSKVRNSELQQQKSDHDQQSPEQILALQQTMGNQAVAQMISSGTLRTKLSLGKPGDASEQEADKTADKVMSMSAGHVQRQTDEENIQPKTAEKEKVQSQETEDEEIQMTPEDEEIRSQPADNEETVQGKGTAESADITDGLASRIQSIKSGGQPLPRSSRTFFEPRFGTKFNNVRIHNDSTAHETSAAINARAYTLGNHIAFAKGQYNPESVEGKRLMAHELAHVVQQGGVSKRINKYEVEGPFNYNEPVHEEMMLQALREAGLIGNDVEDLDDLRDTELWEFVRGVMWNDDPEGLLFDSNASNDSDNYANIQFGRAFLRYKSLALEGRNFNRRGDPLTARSHFGDLQFLHSMAGREMQAASSTLSNMLGWAEFTYKIGIGEITGDQNANEALSSTPVSSIFPNNMTVFNLFLVVDQDNSVRNSVLRMRAIGSLSHMIQDSYTTSHTVRDSNNNIRQFQEYSGQNEDLHGNLDNSENFNNNLNEIPGYNNALNHTVAILRFYQQNTPWATVRQYLTRNVLRLGNYAQPGGVDEQFVDQNRQVYVNTANTYLVSNPSQYQETIIARLSAGTLVEILDRGNNQSFNNTNDENQWFKVKILEGSHTNQEGWLMRNLLSFRQIHNAE